MFSGSPGLAIAIALTCFVGVDTAALYSEETDEPERTVPRATYIAVVAMGVFYVFSIWLIVGSIGSDQLVAKATANPGELIFNDITAVGGEMLQTVNALLFLGASFAGILAFHNAASRYLFVLGRDRVLSPKLGHLHPRHRSPFRASLLVSGGAGLLILIAIAFQLDPLLVLGQGALGLATLGIVTLQALAAVAIVAFFRRRGQGRYWKTLILPGIGAIGLFAIATFLLFNFDDLLGISTPLVNGLPWLIVVVLLIGTVIGLYLRRARAGSVRPARAEPTAPAGAAAAPAGGVDPAVLPDRRRPGGTGDGPAARRGGRAVRLVRGGQRRRGDLARGPARQPGLRHDDRGHIPVRLRFPGLPDAGRLSRLPTVVAGPRLPASVRRVLRSVRPDRLPDRGDLGQARGPRLVGHPDEWRVPLLLRRYRGTWYGLVPGRAALARAGALPGSVWHAARYKTPAELAGRRVLVVGSGTSAADIACDAARAGAVTFLSVRRGRRIRPRHVRGVPTDALLAGVLRPGDEIVAAVRTAGADRRCGRRRPGARAADCRIRTCIRATRPSATTCSRSSPRAGCSLVAR